MVLKKVHRVIYYCYHTHIRILPYEHSDTHEIVAPSIPHAIKLYPDVSWMLSLHADEDYPIVFHNPKVDVFLKFLQIEIGRASCRERV